MRHQLASFIWAFALLIGGASAGASVLNFRGTLEIRVGSAAVSKTTVAVATVNSGAPGLALTRLELPPGIFAANGSAPFGVTPPTLSGVALTALRVSLAGISGADWVRGTASGNLGAMPMNGSLRLCLLGGCAAAVEVSLGVAALTAPTTLDAIPLGTAMDPLGLALPVELAVRTIVGTHTVSTSTATPGLIHVHLPMTTSLTAMTVKAAHTAMSSIRLTLMLAGAGAPPAFVTRFPDGFAAGPLSNSSTVAQAGGVIQMVRPFAILGANTGAVLGTVRTTIEFLPEPLAGVSLASGALLLALLGARRRR